MPKASYSDAQNLMNINLIMVNEITHIRVNTIFKLLNFVNVEKKNTVYTVYHQQSEHRFVHHTEQIRISWTQGITTKE